MVKNCGATSSDRRPRKTAFRYVRWECPDGTYHFLGDGWAVEVERRNGLLFPKRFGGDMARLRALLPDIQPQAN